MLFVCISCGVFPGLGKKGENWSTALYQAIKNQANSAQFHTIHSIPPLIIHICSKNKNTNDQMSFLSGGCYTCEKTLMGGLQVLDGVVCVLSLDCQRGNRRNCEYPSHWASWGHDLPSFSLYVSKILFLKLLPLLCALPL